MDGITGLIILAMLGGALLAWAIYSLRDRLRTLLGRHHSRSRRSGSTHQRHG